MKMRYALLAVLSLWALSAYAGNIDLGAAGSFAVLAGSAVTNTGSTTIYGNLGLTPGSAVTGFPPGIVVPPGIEDVDNGPAILAQNALTTAYDSAMGQPCTTNLTGKDLGGMTLTPGVYCFNSSAELTGTLILNAEGDPSAQFVFQIGSTLTTASSSMVDFINTNGGLPDSNLFWQVGSSATLGTGTDFSGNILAETSITLTTGARIACGSALAQNGAVTLDDNVVSIYGCESSGGAAPEPQTAALFGIGLFLTSIVYGRKAILAVWTAAIARSGGRA
jgi:hypothetical protein